MTYIERDFKEAYIRMKERALDAERDRDKLVKALEPFAKEAETHGDQIPDQMFIWDYEGPTGGRNNIRVGDLRRAKRVFAALAPSAQEGEALEKLIREYARDLRRNSSGGDDYPWEWAKATADYLEVLIERASPHSRPDRGQR